MRKVGDIISDLFRDQFGEEFHESARSSAELFNSWEKIVCEAWLYGLNTGHKTEDSPFTDQSVEEIPAAAAHSKIRELERGVLLVEADHPGWVQILQIKQVELLKAVQRRCPELDVRGIAFTLNRNESVIL